MPLREPFVVTPYFPREDGVLTPQIPDVGPCGAATGEACRLAVDHRRQRKTGPCFPLTVMHCRTHRRGFTLYPPGHVPYGRQLIAPVSFDGAPVRSDEETPYRGTIFRAAFDATAQGQARGAECLRSTERRSLRRLTRLVGVDPGLTMTERAAVSEVLVVALLLLVDQMRRVWRESGVPRSAEAVVAVVSRLPRTPRVADRLAVAGYVAGLWGRPYRWEPECRRLRLLYPHVGTRAPPASRPASGRPRNRQVHKASG